MGIDAIAALLILGVAVLNPSMSSNIGPRASRALSAVTVRSCALAGHCRLESPTSIS